MDCEQCTNEMTAYLDGELSEFRAQEIGVHTKACRSCAAELEALEEAAALMDSRVKMVEPRPEIWHNVHARISAMEVPAPGAGLLGFIEIHRWATVAVALIAAVVLTAGVWEFMLYEKSQNQLQHYMNAYIQERESRDMTASRPPGTSPKAGAAPRSPITPVALSTEDSNPFLQIESIPDSNPFREAQR